MAVRDIAHVEIYARNKPEVVDHFVARLGFARAGVCVLPDRSSILLRRNAIRLTVTSGRGVWRFLEEHGDGIADLAFACTDVRETLARAMAAGFRRLESAGGFPVLAGPGGLTHTLLPAAAADPALPPPDRRWAPSETGDRAERGPVRALDHVAVHLAGRALDRIAGRYRDAFEFCDAPVAAEGVLLRGGAGGTGLALLADDAGDGGRHLAFLIEGPRDARLPAAGERAPYRGHALGHEFVTRRGACGPAADWTADPAGRGDRTADRGGRTTDPATRTTGAARTADRGGRTTGAARTADRGAALHGRG